MFAVLAAALVALLAASVSIFLQGWARRRAMHRQSLRDRVVAAAEAARAPIGFEEASRVLGLRGEGANAFLLRLADDRTLFVGVDERQARLCLFGPSHRPSDSPSGTGRRRRG